MQQALTAGAIDVALGSGPGMGFRAKGVPAIAVAAMYGAPSNMALSSAASRRIKTVADLKGKRIGVTTAGSLTDWLAAKWPPAGLGPEDIQVMPIGAMRTAAAMERGELDAMVVESATDSSSKSSKRGRCSSISATSKRTSTPT